MGTLALIVGLIIAGLYAAEIRQSQRRKALRDKIERRVRRNRELKQRR